MFSPKEIQSARKHLKRGDGGLPVMFAALCDPTRFRIFRILSRHHGSCVTDVAKIFGISVPAASRQLRILERSGLVQRQRMGQEVCYEIEKGTPLARIFNRLIA